jgi:hypothetical protein
MKKPLFITIIFAILVSAGIFQVKNFKNEKGNEDAFALPEAWVKKKKLPKDQRIEGAMEWRYERLANPETGIFNPADYYAAVNHANLLKANSHARSGLNLNWEVIGPDNQGGRTRAILFDKDDSKLIFIGGVAGGMYKSTNGGLNWSPIDSYQGFSSVVSITQANDNNGTIYVGTGEGLANKGATSLNSGASGNGIWRTRDKGATWEHLEATNLLGATISVPGSGAWSEVNDVLISPVNPDLLFAAVENGIRISTNATAPADQVTFSSPSGLTGRGQSLTISPDGTLAFATSGGRTFRSDDVVGNFLSAWVPMPIDVGQRADVKIAPSNPNYVYVTVSNAQGCLVSIWRSTNAGDTWTRIVQGGAPFVLDPFNQPTAAAGSCAGQGWYDHTLVINPVDENKIYIGGITLYTWSAGSGGLKKANRIETEGGNFFDPKYIHADIHKIIFSPHDPTGNTMLIGNDGGVAICYNALSGFPDNMRFNTINKNYNTKQVYGMGAGRYGEAIAGSQDNGTMYVDYQRTSLNAGIDVSGGDGGYGEISHFDPNVLFSTSQFGNIRRSFSRGESAIPFLDEWISWGCGQIVCAQSTPSPCPENGSGGFVTIFHLMETSQKSNPLQSAIIYARNDTLVLSTGETVIVRDTLYPGTYEAQSKVGPVVFEVQLTTTLFPGDTAFFDDPYDAKYFVSTNSCGTWMCTNPLDRGEPKFYRLPYAGNAANYDHSLDGNHLYMVSGSLLTILSGFNQLNLPNPSNRVPISGLTTTTITIPGVGNNLQGVSVDRNDPNHVLVVSAGFTASSPRVWKVTGALSGSPVVTSVHTPTLPFMPMYDCVIDWTNPNRYLLGTELGIWASGDGGATWSEENAGINVRLPVYSLRQFLLYEEGCPVIYAGTHGRGMFRTTSLTPGNCDLTPGKGLVNSLNEISITVKNIKVYPNPVQSEANVVFDMTSRGTVNLKVVDMMGRVVMNRNYNNLAQGPQEVKFDASNLSRGNYMVVLSTNGKSYNSNMFMKM